MNNKNNIKQIVYPIQKELDSFEIKLENIIQKENNFLYNDLHSFIFSNPKRLRPIFILLFSKILNIKNDLVEKIMLITELLHNASLIHDDIIDEEKERRNNLTFNEKYGPKLAVLEGDLLLAIALENLSTTSLEITKIFSLKIKETINGEIIQNENLNKVTDLDTYYKKTQAKTGNLFLCGLESLFTLTKVKPEIQQLLVEILSDYTLAFQIKNDIDNYKNGSTDYKIGNYTLPVIYFFMKNNETDINANKKEFQKFIEKSKDRIEELRIDILKKIINIQDSIYTNSLKELINYTLRS